MVESIDRHITHQYTQVNQPNETSHIHGGGDGDDDEEDKNIKDMSMFACRLCSQLEENGRLNYEYVCIK